MKGEAVVESPAGAVDASGTLPLGWVDLDVQPRIYHIAVSRNDDGSYTAYCVELPGAISEDDSENAAVNRLREAFSLVIDDYKASGKAVPWVKRDIEDGYRVADAIALHD